ncbi:CotH kinase family protein [Verrucomicrobiales bacterium]|nr:CotH kinase family protein [Verrucomicrobiales bacterium]
MHHIIIITLLFQAFGSQLIAEITLSEFLADNKIGITDEDNDYSDWIEITNTTNTNVNLEGWHLTDNPSDLTKWTFPPIEIAANNQLIVFASGKDRIAINSELHTNFLLDSDGEFLALTKPDGISIAKSFNYPRQKEDTSYGNSTKVFDSAVISTSSSAKWLIPNDSVQGWQETNFDDSSWDPGKLGIGYDISSDYDPFFETDVLEQMRSLQTSIYIRVPFKIESPKSVSDIKLKMNYDDGFIAWINGKQIASSNAPLVPEWNARATSSHRDSEAVQKLTIPIDFQANELAKGINILAIQGLNRSQSNSDFLIVPELIISRPREEGPESEGYFVKPTPGQANNDIVYGFVSDTKFSINRGFFTEPINVEITTKTPETTIKYTIDGSDPRENGAKTYLNKIEITDTTTLRAIALKEGFQPSNIDTQTYFYASDIINQPKMDGDITNDPDYSETIKDDLSKNVPIISLTIEGDTFFGPFGIHSNPELSGRGSEVPVSVEFHNPLDSENSFQIDAGIRIHGGNARAHPKKPMRLYFREEYGKRRLNYPIFPESPVQSFDQLILRSGGHDSWSLADSFGRDESLDLPPHGTLMRDQFLRKTELEMGLLSPRGRYIHLYINTEYWGLYDLHERPNAAFFESYLGGTEDEYDVLHHPTFFDENYTIVDGNSIAWETARDIASSGINSTEQFEAIDRIIDIDNLIDHFIVRIWSSDYDWLGPITRNGANVSVFDNKNWYSGRRSRGEAGKFKFFTWDAEMSMGNHLMINLLQFAIPPQGVTNFDLTGVNDSGSPAEFYTKLRTYKPFRIRFGDRLQKLFFNNGIMTVENNTKRWDQMSETIEDAIIAESARWGDEGSSFSAPFTKDDDWAPEVSWVKNEFIAERNEIVLDQFRNRNLFPDIDAPIFNQHGGAVPRQFNLIMSAEELDVYYTTDGTDPYSPVEDELYTLVDDFMDAEALIPSVDNGGADIGIEWRTNDEPDNILEWLKGESGIGYERSGTNYRALINLDLEEMANVVSSAYVRIPFDIRNDIDPKSINDLKLLIKYDDGFVAYLNGTRVASSNAPQPIFWDSASTRNRSDNLAVTSEEFDISNSKNLLLAGNNMLAIQALNDTPQSSDLLCIPKLIASSSSAEDSVSRNAIRYQGPITLNNNTIIKSRSFNPNSGEWSALTEETFIVGTPASNANLVISEFNYHPLGPSTEEEIKASETDTEFEYIELTNIGENEINLVGVRFDQGIDFEFTVDTQINSIRAGEQILIVKNISAMKSRYGDEILDSIAGEFEAKTKLSNNGESLTLLAEDGSTIQSFTYSDQLPWPIGADGVGFTISLIDPSNNPDAKSAENWNISKTPNGSPAGITLFDSSYAKWKIIQFNVNSPSFDLESASKADPDNDGFSNALEYAFGTNPKNISSKPEISYYIQDHDGKEYLALQFTASVTGDDLSIIGEISDDLESWDNSTVLSEISLSKDLSTKQMTLRSDNPIVVGKTEQIRLRVILDK